MHGQYDFDGLSVKEIAARMHLTPSTVCQAIQRGIKHIRQHPVRAERFRQAVIAKRRALDARIPNRPWNDIDADAVQEGRDG